MSQSPNREAESTTAPDLSRLRGMAALPSTILLRVSPEELRYLLGAVDELAQLREEASALRHDLAQARAERGAAQRQAAASYARAEELREAATALVTDLESPEADQIWMCERCPAVAMVRAEGGVCDAHAEGREISRDLSYAAPLRALRTLLGRS